jgi:sphingosine kinase
MMCECLGSTRPLDIMALTPLKTGRTYYAHEMITWTIVADVDIESERFRWAGAARFTVSAVVRIFNLRKYRAKIYYLLHSHDPNANETDLSVEDTTSPSNESDGVVSNGPPLKLTNFCRQRRDTDDAPLEIPDGWKTYDGTIVHFIASSIPWISSDAYISPKAGISSGHIDLVWASETNDSLKMLSVLTDSGKGDYLHIPGIHWHQVRALIIEPMGRARNADIKGIMDVDGEVVPCEATAVECLPGLMTMITPAWFDEAKVARRHVYEKKQRQQQQKAQK